VEFTWFLNAGQSNTQFRKLETFLSSSERLQENILSFCVIEGIIFSLWISVSCETR